jgi:hypothetical protein
MKNLVRAASSAFLLLASQGLLAGTTVATPVPTLGEAGLAVFAISLAGGGVVLIRRRRR